MKKFLAVLLAVTLILMLVPLAAAEAQAPAAPLVQVDLTGLIIALLVAAFEFLLAWLVRAAIPPLKKWLEVHATAEQQSMLWNITVRLVDAMEQTIVGPGRGKERLAGVVKGIEAYGFTADVNMIEAAVKQMKERGMAEIGQELGVKDKTGE